MDRTNISDAKILKCFLDTAITRTSAILQFFKYVHSFYFDIAVNSGPHNGIVIHIKPLRFVAAINHIKFFLTR